MEEELMKIGDFADFFNISRKSLRIYEKKGIIKPVKIDPNTGYRYYSADQAKQVNAILELKLLGFSLDEINKLLNKELSSEKLYEVINRKRRIWEEQIQVAQDRIDTIDSIAQRIEHMGGASKLQTMTEDERAMLLVKMVCVEDIAGKNVLREAIWL